MISNAFLKDSLEAFPSHSKASISVVRSVAPDEPRRWRAISRSRDLRDPTASTKIETLKFCRTSSKAVCMTHTCVSHPARIRCSLFLHSALISPSWQASKWSFATVVLQSWVITSTLCPRLCGLCSVPIIGMSRSLAILEILMHCLRTSSPWWITGINRLCKSIKTRVERFGFIFTICFAIRSLSRS